VVIVADEGSPLQDLTRPAHVYWDMDDDAAYVDHAGRLLSHGESAARDLDLDAPLFRLVAGEGDVWRLSGEIDLAVTSHLAAALTAVTARPRCEIDVTGLEFIDVGGMATLADAARRSHTHMRLLGASRVLRRSWQLAGFDESAPTVELVA
jgi:anti-anti-sigma factor